MKHKLVKIIIRIIGYTLIGVIALFLMIDHYVSTEGMKYIIDMNEENTVDAIVILGAKVINDEVPSIILQDRLITGVEAYNIGASKKILVTGDHGTKEYDEVNTMRKYIKEKGVAEEDIFMDHAGFSTYESMYRAKAVFCIERAIIITQEYHLKRALYIARSLGIEAYGIPSDKHIYPKMSYYELRERAARVKDFIKTKLKMKPTYLGESIPIAGIPYRRTGFKRLISPYTVLESIIISKVLQWILPCL